MDDIYENSEECSLNEESKSLTISDVMIPDIFSE